MGALSVCLSVSVFLCLSLCFLSLSVCVFARLSVGQPLSFCLCPSICPSVSVFARLCLSDSLLSCLSTCVCVFVFVHQSVSVSGIYLCPPACPYLSGCLSLFICLCPSACPYLFACRSLFVCLCPSACSYMSACLSLFMCLCPSGHLSRSLVLIVLVSCSLSLFFLLVWAED